MAVVPGDFERLPFSTRDLPEEDRFQGATRDDALIGQGRGTRAARLCAIKSDILEHLGDSDLKATTVALRQRVTPRYVHMLFEGEGTTFSAFVLERRLDRVRRMLAGRQWANSSITAIAFAAGFGDLSYFNRTFRRRFGITPSEVRRNGHGKLH
jgi:AraC-like DNA-binding protein